MSASTDLALNESLRRFADLVPVQSAHSGAIDGQDGREAEFNIAELGATLAVPGRVGPSSGEAVAVLGRRRRGMGICAPYRVESAEVLIGHTGRWRVFLEGDGATGSFEIGGGDVISVPAGAPRRLELLDDESGFLFVIRGILEDDGAAPRVAVCKSFAPGGLSAMHGGAWIDDSGGVPVLRTMREGDALVIEGTPSVASSLDGLLCKADSMPANPRSPFSSEGVEDAAVVVPNDTADGFVAGPIRGWWPHGFNLRLLTLATGAYVPAHRRSDALALIVQDGTLEVRSCDESVILGAGDTMPISPAREHALRNVSSRIARVFVVIASENPANPDFASLPIRGCY